MGPRFLAAAAAAALLVPAHASAQPQPQPQRRSAVIDPSAAELAAYRLSTGTLQKVSIAMQALSKALETDTRYQTFKAAEKELEDLQNRSYRTATDERRVEALEQQLEQMSEEMSPGEAQTLDEMERRMGALPHMAQALAAGGLTAREYAKFTITLGQSGYFVGMWRAHQLRQLPPGVSLENVQFVIDHERELAALTAQMQGR